MSKARRGELVPVVHAETSVIQAFLDEIRVSKCHCGRENTAGKIRSPMCPSCQH